MNDFCNNYRFVFIFTLNIYLFNFARKIRENFIDRYFL